MYGDLLSDNFAELVDKSLVKRNIRLITLLLILSCFYAVLEIVEWWPFLFKKNYFLTTHNFYLYKIRPLIAISLLILSVISTKMILQAHSIILHSFEIKDGALFNRGYALLCRVSYISVAAYIISLASLTARLIFKY